MDITTGTALHLAAATPLAGTMNVCYQSAYVGPRLDPSVPTRNGGHITPKTAPMIGVNPDLDLLGKPERELAA